MLPFSCRRLADSKSNSSTRLPRRTTTRVSSGWVASISILLAIDRSLDGGRMRPCLPATRAAQDGTTDASLTVVEGLGLERARGKSIVRNDVGWRRACDADAMR